LTESLLEAYQRAGEEVPYWAARFREALKRKGGLPTAKRMLRPRNSGQRAGLDTLLDANRPDLTMEAVILQPQFRSLFSEAELQVAAERLGEYGKDAARRAAKPPEQNPRYVPD